MYSRNGCYVRLLPAGIERKKLRAVKLRTGPADSDFLDRVQNLYSRSLQRVRRVPFLLALAVFALPVFAPNARAQGIGEASLAATPSLPPEPTIIIGFVGGRVHHDDPYHAEVQLAGQLQEEYSKTADIQVFENKREEVAHQWILDVLDTNHDGKLSMQEKQRARIVLYGHSWGACAVVMLAQDLEKDGIPVLLTVQVDSVAKHKHEDNVVPANVERAVNFYQPRGKIHGIPEITAADPAHTQILGNYRFDYDTQQVSCVGYPWYAHIVFRNHVAIECDPRVWSQISSLIRSEISPSAPNLATTTSTN